MNAPEHRYVLTREWDADPIAYPGPNLGVALWVMLNPSTADETVDDPTIRRCIHFSRRTGCGSMIVVNLYSARATDPAELRKLPLFQRGGDDSNDVVLKAAFGMQRDRIQVGALTDRSVVIVAWGEQPYRMWPNRVPTVLGMLEGMPLFCLGTTKKGYPRHPLYLGNDVPLRTWEPK